MIDMSKLVCYLIIWLFQIIYNIFSKNKIHINFPEPSFKDTKVKPDKTVKRNYKDDNVNMKTPDWFDKEINKSNVSDGEENQLEELLKEYK